MRNRWLTILLVLYMGYALLFYKKEQSPLLTSHMNENKIEAPGIIDKIKTYAEILSADPKLNSLTTDKNQPLLQAPPEAVPSTTSSDTLELKKPYVATSASAANSIPPPPLKELSENEKLNFFQNKLFNVIYNVLHTTQGKELVEKLLLNPPANADPSEEENLYRNNSKLDVFEGEGEPAGCGDIVTTQYIIRLVSGQEVENTYKLNKPTTFQLGDQKVIKGLEYAIIGMKKDGRRRLVIPPKLAYNESDFSRGVVANNEFVTLDVELIDIKPSIDNWQNKINIFQDSSKRKNHPVLCSSEVYFKYKISTTDEKILAQSSKAVHFTLGSTEVPPAINRAFSGISDQSKRVVLIPSSLLYNKKISFIPAKVKFPPKGMLILEIDTNISIAD